MNKQQPALILQYLRNNIPEQQHFGFVLQCNKKEILFTFGDSHDEPFFMRSCMKPLQATLLIDFDLINYFKLNSEEIAICAASHAGEPEHIRVIKKLLNKIGMNENDLKCPPSQPLSKTAQLDLIKRDKQPGRIHHNCSGKHILMLMACIKNKWSIENYDKMTHPLQLAVIEKVRVVTQYQDEITISKDGCGLPICAIPLHNIALSYLNLFLSKKYSEITKSILKHPYLIGGTQRLDSEIINASNGTLVAKVGAGGLCTIVNLEKKEAIIVKIADANMTTRSIVTIETLKNHGWLSNEQITGSSLQFLYDKTIKTSHGELVGEIECFPE